jgi:hypothetical protein
MEDGEIDSERGIWPRYFAHMVSPAWTVRGEAVWITKSFGGGLRR